MKQPLTETECSSKRYLVSMDWTQARNRMVEAQVARRGISDSRVLEALRAVPRQAFVPPEFQDMAYEDCALPIAKGQSISQPYIVAAMLAAAQLKAGDTALEIGAGSGYVAALLGQLVRKVYAIERHAGLSQAAHERLSALGYRNIAFKTGDGSGGWPEAAPFDAIIVSAAMRRIAEPLKLQLATGGRLVAPVGEWDEQKLIRLTRQGEDVFQQETLEAVRFVKLIGPDGWNEGGWDEPAPACADP